MKGQYQGSDPVRSHFDTLVNNCNTTLRGFDFSASETKNEIILSYPVSDGNIILLIAGTDGYVANMQVLSAGSTVTTIDTSTLSTGPYMLVVQNSTDRRIFEFNKC